MRQLTRRPSPLVPARVTSGTGGRFRRPIRTPRSLLVPARGTTSAGSRLPGPLGTPRSLLVPARVTTSAGSPLRGPNGAPRSLLVPARVTTSAGGRLRAPNGSPRSLLVPARVTTPRAEPARCSDFVRRAKSIFFGVDPPISESDFGLTGRRQSGFRRRSISDYREHAITAGRRRAHADATPPRRRRAASRYRNRRGLTKSLL